MRAFVCITCGPASEKIDTVRRITNFSTGEIGFHLASAAQAQGAVTICFRGEGSIAAVPPGEVRGFSSNASLESALWHLEAAPDLIFHAAALSDFVPVLPDRDAPGKLDSRDGPVRLTLEPTHKLLPRMVQRFPKAVVIGWKYEVDGGRSEALERARRQLKNCGTHACVVNGPAFGDGFGLVLPETTSIEEFPDKPTLSRALAEKFIP